MRVGLVVLVSTILFLFEDLRGMLAVIEVVEVLGVVVGDVVLEV
jgi:hypothetical protein